MLLNAFPMLLYALLCFMSSLEEEEQMMLALCITGFCFAEAGKNEASILLELPPPMSIFMHYLKKPSLS